MEITYNLYSLTLDSNFGKSTRKLKIVPKNTLSLWSSMALVNCF